MLNTQNPALDNRVQSFILGHTYTLTSSLVSSFHLGGWTRNIVSRNIAPDSINPNTIGIQSYAPIKNYLYMNDLRTRFTVRLRNLREPADITTNSVTIVLEDIVLDQGQKHIGRSAPTTCATTLVY